MLKEEELMKDFSRVMAALTPAQQTAVQDNMLGINY